MKIDDHSVFLKVTLYLSESLKTAFATSISYPVNFPSSSYENGAVVPTVANVTSSLPEDDFAELLDEQAVEGLLSDSQSCYANNFFNAVMSFPTFFRVVAS